jgi:aryl-alcohol dehydrogenase-like predicted oxidoreductase
MLDDLAATKRFDYSYDGVMRSIEQSVIRLGFEEIDVLFIHDVDRWTQGKDFPRTFAAAMEGAYRALDDLRKHGSVKAIGVGINEADVAADFLRAGDFDCVMLAGRYTLLDQSALDVFMPLAKSRGVDVFMAAVFNSGVLAKPTAKTSLTTMRLRLTRLSAVQGASQRSAASSMSRSKRRRFNFREATPLSRPSSWG